MDLSDPEDQHVHTQSHEETKLNGDVTEPCFNTLQLNELAIAVQHIFPLSEDCTDNSETQNNSSEIVLCQGSVQYPKGLPRGPPTIAFYGILESTSCTSQAFNEGYRHIRREAMNNMQLSRVSWEDIRADPHADPLTKCVYFSHGVVSAPENLDYILRTWNDVSHQLIRGNSFEIGSLLCFYTTAWTIYNRAEYGHLPNDSECILFLRPWRISLTKEGAMKLIDYCLEKMEFMSDFVRKPYFYITKLRWQFEYKCFMGNLDESAAKTILRGIDETARLCNSFKQDWMKLDSFGAMGSAIKLKMEIALYFKTRLHNIEWFCTLVRETKINLKDYEEYFEKNCSNIPLYDQAWMYCIQSKFYRMTYDKQEAQRYAKLSVHRYLECGRHWRALEEAKHTGDTNLIEYCQSINDRATRDVDSLFISFIYLKHYQLQLQNMLNLHSYQYTLLYVT